MSLRRRGVSMMGLRISILSFCAALAACTSAPEQVQLAPSAPVDSAQPERPLSNAATVAKPAVKATATDACNEWLTMQPALGRYLSPTDGPDAATPSAAVDEAKLAAAFHRFMLAFLHRDAKALLALLPLDGNLIIVNTMEAQTGLRPLTEVRKQLIARRGPHYADLLAGEEDDYADRFAVRAALPWCRTGTTFFLLGDHPADLSFVRFSGDQAPKLVAFGTAGL